MNRVEVLFFILLVSCVALAEDDVDREERVLFDFNNNNNNNNGNLGVGAGIFNIYRFQNGPCTGDGNINGTCYTAGECESRGGTNSGNCAGSLGVCCTFSGGCGTSFSENCTYFQSSSTVSAGVCRMQICPCNENICQLRLDFTNFVITGPSTSSAITQGYLNGEVSTVPGRLLGSDASRCLTDTFAVTSPGNNAPPVICGTNTGEHMYVEASDSCNDLVFALGQTANGAPLANRNFNIKVTQISCDSNLRAPEGCTQYFTGNTVGVVQTYNFAGGQHLANQNQRICVRQEAGNCRICWTTMAATDFAVSSPAATVAGFNLASKCCAYGSDGKSTNGFDCVVIPGAFNVINTDTAGNQICGRNAGLVAGNGVTTPKTVCSTQQPFRIEFVSDGFEFTGTGKEATVRDVGFRLVYIQDNTNCVPATLGG